VIEPDDQIRVYVEPDPSPEEMAAISAVVALALQQGSASGDGAQPAGGGRERWTRAGRREVLRSAEWFVEREWRP
jgi:hypothetical protein